MGGGQLIVFRRPIAALVLAFYVVQGPSSAQADMTAPTLFDMCQGPTKPTEVVEAELIAAGWEPADLRLVQPYFVDDGVFTGQELNFIAGYARSTGGLGSPRELIIDMFTRLQEQSPSVAAFPEDRGQMFQNQSGDIFFYFARFGPVSDRIECQFGSMKMRDFEAEHLIERATQGANRTINGWSSVVRHRNIDTDKVIKRVYYIGLTPELTGELFQSDTGQFHYFRISRREFH